MVDETKTQTDGDAATTTLIQPAATPKKKKGEGDADTQPSTQTEVPAEAPKASKRYAVKVAKDSPIRTVRSAGIIFTDAEQMFGEDDAQVAELQRNPWLEVREVTE